MPSATYVISFRQISRRHWLVVSSSQESTTAMLSCTVLQPAASRSWSVCTSLLPGLFCRLQGSPTSHHYCVSSIGCRSDSGSHRSADVQDALHGDTCLPQPSHHSARLWAHSTYLHSPQFYCCPYRSTRLLSRDELSAALLLPPGTLCRTNCGSR